MSDEQYQVLYSDNGVEWLSDPEPYTEAVERATKLDKDGYKVGSILTVKGAKRHQAQRAEAAEADGQSPFFPIEEYKKAHRDVEAEVDDSLTTNTDGEPSAKLDPYSDRLDRFHRRHMAVELALKLREGDFWTAEELVAASRAVLGFLEG